MDRMYQPGDLLKRSVDDVRSGMVTGCVPHPRSATSASHPPACASPAARSATVLGRLEHAISGESVSGWKRLDEVDAVVDLDMGDYVVHNDWVGQVRTNDTEHLSWYD